MLLAFIGGPPILLRGRWYNIKETVFSTRSFVSLLVVEVPSSKHFANLAGVGVWFCFACTLEKTYLPPTRFLSVHFFAPLLFV